MSIISGMSGMSEQFRTQMHTNATTIENYERVINDTFVAKKWDLFFAKLDSFLNYITNGSWSLSEKTVLIHEIDNFRGKLLTKLDSIPTDKLNDLENIACTIDRELFRFVMKNISTKPLSPDVTLDLKLNQEGRPVIQLNSASGLLAEYPDNRFIQFHEAKHIPQGLSQLLCTLMSLCEQSCLWPELYQDVYHDLSENVSTAAAHSFAELDDFDFSSRITVALSELRTYLKLTGYDAVIPMPLDFYLDHATFNKKTELWNSIQEWIKTATPNDLSAIQSIKDNICDFLAPFPAAPATEQTSTVMAKTYAKG